MVLFVHQRAFLEHLRKNPGPWWGLQRVELAFLGGRDSIRAGREAEGGQCLGMITVREGAGLEMQ